MVGDDDQGEASSAASLVAALRSVVRKAGAPRDDGAHLHRSHSHSHSSSSDRDGNNGVDEHHDDDDDERQDELLLTTGIHGARALDAADDFPTRRDRFHIPRVGGGTTTTTKESGGSSSSSSSSSVVEEGEEVVYMCGNSLGLQPRDAALRVQEELDVWARRGVEGHFAPRSSAAADGADDVDPAASRHGHDYGREWVRTDDFVREQLAHVVGAADPATEVVAMGSLTSNLHVLMMAFYRPTPQRFRIAIEKGAFPSDLYAVQSQVRLHGFDPDDAVLQLGNGERTTPNDDLEAQLRKHGDSIALVLLAGVQYYTGQLFDIPRLTRVGHEIGARVGWDLAHAAGNVELRLHDWDVDFACWCHYKYLNAGPGAIAGAFLHSKFKDATLEELPRLGGWWGHKLATRFTMREPQIDLEPGIASFRLSNPPVVSIATVLASADIFFDATMPALVAKSRRLTAYLELLVHERLRHGRVTVLTPANLAERGAQLSLDFGDDISAVAPLLEAKGVVADVRKPSVIRVAPAPLYNTFEDVWKFVDRLSAALHEVNACKPSGSGVAENKRAATGNGVDVPEAKRPRTGQSTE